MTDRELLELAAKAYGFKSIMFYAGDEYACCHDNEGYEHVWSPLTDDGDALRLAVKLKLHVQVNEAAVVFETWQSDICETKEVTEYFDLADETYAATRRAIVRAAAEIGRNMK